MAELGLLDELGPEFLGSPTMCRLAAYVAERGRPLRVLHIGNIANNGYNNAKMLNAAGVESDVIAYDYYHIMGCPEWEDADITGVIDDDMAPDWSAVDLGGFVRPRWFAQGPRETATRYLRSRYDQDDNRRVEAAAVRLDRALVGHVRATKAPSKLAATWHKRHRVRSAAAYRYELFESRLGRYSPRRIRHGLAWRTSPQRAALSRATAPARAVARSAVSSAAAALEQRERPAPQFTPRRPDPFLRRCYELIAEFDERFPDRPDRLTRKDFDGYRSVVADWTRTFDNYDLIEAYSTDPILAMLVGTKPYVAYEHGTIRDIPFEDDARGRLTALAYAMADGVVITNPDCRDAAERLGVRDYRFIPHLIDRKYYDHQAAKSRPLPPGLREPYVFCPARQHWSVKGNDIALAAFAEIAHEFADVQLVLSSWGPDVERTADLLSELGIRDRAVLIDPLRIRDLIAVTRRAEVLVDQFHFAVFGGIGPTALACGTPLVTNLDHSLSQWCMDKPPYFQASDRATCRDALVAALNADRKAHRQAQLDWMHRNYWYGDVATRHIDLFLDILDGPDSLGQCKPADRVAGDPS